MNYFKKRLTVEEVSNFFDLIKQEETSLGNYQKNDGNLVTIKDFFKAYHHGKTCIYTDEEKKIAEADFIRIYQDAYPIVFKIKNEEKLLVELSNLEKNWQDVTRHEQESENILDGKLKIDSNDEHIDTRGGKYGTLEGFTDSSKFAEVTTDNLLGNSNTKIMSYLDPNSRERRHLINIEGGENKLNLKDDRTNKTDDINKGKMNYTSTRSNTSKDIIDYMETKLPQLRNEFLMRFNGLFYG